MPLSFSIIICTRNSMPHLEESVGSVLMQDGVSAEIVFVDGGATDGTLELIGSLQRPYRLIENLRGGYTRAINAGIRAATGDVLAFLRPDAYYLAPDMLATAGRHLDAGRHGWLFGNAMADVDGRLTEKPRAPCYSHERLLQGNFIAEPAVFVRRELAQRVGGFDPHLRHAMAYDLWLKLGCLSKPFQLDAFIAAQREDEGSIFARKRLARMDEELRVRLAHADSGRLARGLHHARHFIERQRAIQSGSGKEYAEPAAWHSLGAAQRWRKRMRAWLAG